MFKASDVKELREKTGAGMLDCKKALEATDGNMEKAIDWLREKGIAKAAKKESRIAAEGLCQVLVDGNQAVVLEVNSETDFVAKNALFVDFVDYLAEKILANPVSTVEEVLAISDENETISDKLVALTAKIGEKISFRRFEKISKNDDEVFGTYKHMGGKIGAIVVLKGANEEIAKDEYTLVDPTDETNYTKIQNYTVRELQKKIFENGKLIYKDPSIFEKRDYCKKEMQTLYPEIRRIEKHAKYYVDLSEKLLQTKKQMILNNKKYE